MATTPSFEQSYQYFLANEAALKQKYDNRVIVIYIDKVLGVYNTVREAYFTAPKEHNVVPGTFIIQNLTAEGMAARRYVGNRLAFNQ